MPSLDALTSVEARQNISLPRRKQPLEKSTNPTRNQHDRTLLCEDLPQSPRLKTYETCRRSCRRSKAIPWTRGSTYICFVHHEQLQTWNNRMANMTAVHSPQDATATPETTKAHPRTGAFVNRHAKVPPQPTTRNLSHLPTPRHIYPLAQRIHRITDLNTRC